jgi:calmodulin
VDPEGTGKFDFPEFISLMAKNYKEVDAEEELLEAFRVFDKNNTGEIGSTELKFMIKSIGEKLTEEEAEIMI